MNSYIANIIKAHHFWLHLVMADLRAKYRRSTLGLAWAIIQPLSMTLLLSFVMGKIFHAQIKDYAPFIFSGLIFWEFVMVSTVAGSAAFVNAESYIKQFNHPLLIYSLRSTLAALINLLFAFIGLMTWVLLWKPQNFGLCWLSLIPNFILLFLFAWAFGSISAFIGTRFRDFSQLIVIILQAIWYTSPVYFLPEVFKNAHLAFLVDNNPVYHLLNIFRAPLLQGEFPPLISYYYTILLVIAAWSLAVISTAKLENRVIYYL